MRQFMGFALSLILLFSLAACSQDPPPASASLPYTCPHRACGAGDFPAENRIHPPSDPGRRSHQSGAGSLIWEGLFELDNTFTARNVLCDSYSVSEDGLVWTFYLRTGITFSDGSPLTAAEAAQSLQLAKKAGTRYSGRLSAVVSAVSRSAHPCGYPGPTKRESSRVAGYPHRQGGK
jgi:peptide/nickel transport system substrate-binding protein